jgi:dipeptidyl aminopeptidase/acylaminoacyl peptidase
MPAPFVTDRQQFKSDGVGYLNRRNSHIYVLDLQSGDLSQLTNGEYDNGSPVWAPDGKRIAFTSNRTENPDGNGDIDVWVMSAQMGDEDLQLISRSDDMDWSPTWSLNGRYLAYRTYEEPDVFYFALRRIEVFDVQAGTYTTVVPSLDRSVHNAKFSPDAQHLYFVVEDQGKFNLARVAASGKGEPEMVTDGNNTAASYALGGDGSIVVRNGSYRDPGNYFSSGNLFAVTDGGLRQLTHHNEQRYNDIELVDGEPIWYPTRDGYKIQAWVYKPADFDPTGKYPLVIDLHGGSVMQVGYRFEGMAQLLAANGYVVMIPNYRGSSGYGRAHQKANMPHMYNGDDYRDVADGARYMASLPYIDGERMAVQGWSYGGGLTSKLITAEPDLFAAAISGAGVSLRYGEYGTDIYQAAVPKILGLPWENRSLWQRDQAFDNIGRATTPTMFVHGEKDWNVPVSNSERMYQAMRTLGRETLLVVYPNQPHALQVPRYEEHRMEMYLKWYGKYLQ